MSMTKIRTDIKIGKIEYLHRGKVVDQTEYEDEAEFMRDIKDELAYQVPINVILYRDRHGKVAASYALRKLEGAHNHEENVVVAI